MRGKREGGLKGGREDSLEGIKGGREGGLEGKME